MNEWNILSTVYDFSSPRYEFSANSRDLDDHSLIAMFVTK